MPEQITDSTSALRSEFVRVLYIRNSFYAERQLYKALLSCQERLSSEVRIFYEMRRSECAYGCEKAQQAVQYAQDYAAAQGMDVNFTELLTALSYPEVAEESDGFLIPNVPSSSDSTDVAGSTSMTMMSNTGQGSRLSKQIISETYFKNWKDR